MLGICVYQSEVNGSVERIVSLSTSEHCVLFPAHQVIRRPVVIQYYSMREICCTLMTAALSVIYSCLLLLLWLMLQDDDDVV